MPIGLDQDRRRRQPAELRYADQTPDLPRRDDRSLRIGAVGIDSGPIGNADPTAVTAALLARLAAGEPTPPLAFEFGDQTLTAGELELAHRRDPEAFVDFLEANGVTQTMLQEVADDILAKKIEPGAHYDLTKGSDLHAAYAVGPVDADPAFAAALQNAPVVSRSDLSDELVQRPGLFRRVADAISEAVGAISRLFGKGFDPDTVTFDGRVDDAHFASLGARHAFERPEELALLFDTNHGEAQLRASLLAQKPERATERQWARAVDRYVAGAHDGLAALPETSRPPDLEPPEAALALVHLRAGNYGDQARRELAIAASAPAEVRDEAIANLVTLPAEEKQNMLDLLAEERPADAEAALFSAFARDHFTHEIASPPARELARAVDDADRVPAQVRDRYLALATKLGPDGAHFMTSGDRGVAALLQEHPAHADSILDRIEAAPSTRTLARTLASSTYELHLDPKTPPLTGRHGRDVVAAFDRHDLALERTTTAGETFTISARGGDGARDVSLERYVADGAYRTQVLDAMGMDRAAFDRLAGAVEKNLYGDYDPAFVRMELANYETELANPKTSDTRRAEIAHALRVLRFDQVLGRPPANTTIDISAGSETDQFFGLDGSGPDAAVRAASARLAEHRPRNDFVVKLPGEGLLDVSIARSDMTAILQDPATAEAKFASAYPGLDFGETVLLFGALEQRQHEGKLPPANGTAWPELDLTQRHPDRAIDSLRRRHADGRPNNIDPGRAPSVVAMSRSTADEIDATTLPTGARIGGGGGNNWFQYGIYNEVRGYESSIHLEASAKARFDGHADPAHVLGAVFDVEDFDKRTQAKGVWYQQNGFAVGHTPDEFLVDRATGTRATGEDLSLLSFRGDAHGQAAFKATVSRVQSVFENQGGVPRSNMSSYVHPSPSEMYAAIASELSNDPRPTDARDAPRTVVVHFAGHTASDAADVDGMNVSDGFFTPDDVDDVNALARSHGVNVVWVVDACRAGAYLEEARADRIDELGAIGALPPQVEPLEGLRTALIDRHRALAEIRGSKEKGAPTWEQLEAKGTAVLRGEPNARAELDAMVSGRSDAYSRYRDAIVATLDHRTALEGQVDKSVLDAGLLRGTKSWRPGRHAMTHDAGPTLDAIDEALRDRLRE